jgi:hypothetical protein
MGCEKVIKPRCKVPKTEAAEPGSAKCRCRTKDCLKNSRRGFLNGRCLVAEDAKNGLLHTLLPACRTPYWRLSRFIIQSL